MIEVWCTWCALWCTLCMIDWLIHVFQCFFFAFWEKCFWRLDTGRVGLQGPWSASSTRSSTRHSSFDDAVTPRSWGICTQPQRHDNSKRDLKTVKPWQIVTPIRLQSTVLVKEGAMNMLISCLLQLSRWTFAVGQWRDDRLWHLLG